MCKKNDHAAARVRLTVSRGVGGLYDDAGQLNYVIQSWPLDPIELNENGLVIDVYEGARKCCDSLANCKTNNFLPYVMAALEAKNKTFIVYINETYITSIPYDKVNKIGRLKQIIVAFKGSGTIDWVKLYNSNTGTQLIQEDFNIDKRSNTIWY